MNRAKTEHSMLRAALLALLLALAGGGLAGCSSSDNQAARDGTDDGGGTEAKRADDAGEISALAEGALVVNGTRYRLDASTRVMLDGEPVSAGALRLGALVDVEVPPADFGRDGAVARVIDIRPRLDGVIDSLEADAGRLVAAGLTVVIDRLTRIVDSDGSPRRLSELEPGQRVRVFALVRADGELVATRIERRSDGGAEIVLRGRISDTDTARNRFRLNGLTVDFSAAVQLEPVDGFEDGDRVFVAGSVDRDERVLRAERVIEREDRDRPPPERAGFAGFVTAVDETSACPNLRFEVRDRPVQVSAATEYRHGGCGDIEVGRRVAVVGRPGDDGVLDAELVALVPPVDAVVGAEVEELAIVDDGSGAPRCLLTVLGDLQLRVDERTREGASTDSHGDSFGCRRVRVGDLVIAVGRFEAGSDAAPDRVDALRIKSFAFRDQPAQFEGLSILAGRVQALRPVQRQFDLLGTVLQTSSDTDFGDSSELEFYAETAPGDFAGVLGRWNGAVVEASAVRRGFVDEFDGSGSN